MFLCDTDWVQELVYCNLFIKSIPLWISVGLTFLHYNLVDIKANYFHPYVFISVNHLLVELSNLVILTVLKIKVHEFHQISDRNYLKMDLGNETYQGTCLFKKRCLSSIPEDWFCSFVLPNERQVQGVFYHRYRTKNLYWMRFTSGGESKRFWSSIVFVFISFIHLWLRSYEFY